jgi:hypothetical protein
VLLYEAVLAIEMAVITTKFRTGERNSNLVESNRHIAYHLFVFLVVAMSAFIPYRYDEIVQDEGDFHCHYAIGPSELFIFLPALLSIVTVVVTNVYSMRNILTMMSAFMPTSGQHNDELRDSAGRRTDGETTHCGCLSALLEAAHTVSAWLRRTHDTFRRFDPYTRKTVFRITMQPLLYLLLLVSAFVLLATTPAAVGNFATLSLVLVMAPANAALWIFNDEVAVRAWGCLLRGEQITCATVHLSDSSDQGASGLSAAAGGRSHSNSGLGGLGFGLSPGGRQERLLSAGSHMSDVANFTVGEHVPRLTPLLRAVARAGDGGDAHSSGGSDGETGASFSAELV